ncbi:hypothetical protein PRIPAC_96064 [Pristionchus pacificus]|uniref:Uncharacterized protein n=1 Tax=Pristionchus pacificus TaxID=54126 RepID=A0A2A6CUU3_PRIPA|nr:hypothetical protein PRIPAC_96064 [Pristionchus pacificus]|eukprot:PDM81856.1 hypothetical protein PRIPAC_34010 [Pristionchus pacificus]
MADDKNEAVDRINETRRKVTFQYELNISSSDSVVAVIQNSFNVLRVLVKSDASPEGFSASKSGLCFDCVSPSNNTTDDE